MRNQCRRSWRTAGAREGSRGERGSGKGSGSSELGSLRRSIIRALTKSPIRLGPMAMIPPIRTTWNSTSTLIAWGKRVALARAAR